MQGRNSYDFTIPFILFQRSIGLPDVHSGYGFAIGNMAAFDMNDPEAVVSPGKDDWLHLHWEIPGMAQNHFMKWQVFTSCTEPKQKKKKIKKNRELKDA